MRALGGLGLSPTTVTVLFTVILLISGLIAFCLGLAEEHPAQRRLRCAQRRINRVEKTRDAAERRYAADREALGELQDIDMDVAQVPYTSQVTVLDADYLAAAAAYLGAVDLKLGNPSVTQAIGIYLKHLSSQAEAAAMPASRPGSRP